MLKFVESVCKKSAIDAGFAMPKRLGIEQSKANFHGFCTLLPLAAFF